VALPIVALCCLKGGLSFGPEEQSPGWARFSEKGISPVMQKQDRVDVARIMRELRDETRARHEELARRIERAAKQLEEQILQTVASQRRSPGGGMLGGSQERIAAYAAEEDPGYNDVRRFLMEVRRINEEAALPRSPRDRWWNPRWWMKRALLPVRRFVLRGQKDINAMLRDSVGFLVGRVQASHHDFHLWLLASVPVLARYIEELHERGLARQAEALTHFQEKMDKRLMEFAADWGRRLDRAASPTQGEASDKAGGAIGFDTLRFAESLRGSPEEVSRHQARYLAFLVGQQNILDAGCGRGEFLELLRERGIGAYGVDCDEMMVRYCHERGLDVRREDLLDHLDGLSDNSLGGVVAFQVIEHLDFVSFFQMLRLAARKIRPQGVIILETVNPTCLTTFSGAFYADPTHHHPLHPEAVRRMVEIVGFGEVKIEYINPIEESDKLKLLPTDQVSDPNMRRLIEVLNQNLRRINSLLYNYADYAIIGQKPA